MNINLSTARASQTKQIDLTRLPVTQVDKGFKGAGFFLMLFACLWGGIPTFILMRAASSGPLQPGLWGLLIFGVIGIGIFLGGLYLLTTCTTTHLSLETVGVTKQSLFGTKQWIARLSEFIGVRYRSEYHSGGEDNPSYTLYIVELLHKSDAKKAVRLYEARADFGVRGIWENACSTLNLPAVEGDGANLVSRDVEDLDKSVKDLAREGKLQVKFDLSKPPPAGLSLKVDSTFLELSIKTKKGSSYIGSLIGLVFSGVFVYIGFFVKGCPLLFGIVGCVIMLIVILATIWSLITTEQIRVAKDEIHVRRQTPWGPTKGTRIDTTGVEIVRIGKKDSQGTEGILIETDAGTLIIATGLPAPCLEWLKNCILKVITA